MSDNIRGLIAKQYSTKGWRTVVAADGLVEGPFHKLEARDGTCALTSLEVADVDSASITAMVGITDHKGADPIVGRIQSVEVASGTWVAHRG